MKKYRGRRPSSNSKFISPPAYPFSGRELLADLRDRLATAEGRQFGYAELARLMGQSTSTVHFWFSSYRHPHLIAFMSLLERLSFEQRQAFLRSHCRMLPLLSDSILVGQTAELRKLLNKPAGCTIIVGQSDKARAFVLTGFGHSWRQLHAGEDVPTGIDVQRPLEFVPIEGMRYIDDRLDRDEIRELVLSAWPKLATSRTRLLLGNQLWSLVPEVRSDLLRVARYRHVILAEKSIHEFASLGAVLQPNAHVVKVSELLPSKAIHLTCHRMNS